MPSLPSPSPSEARLAAEVAELRARLEAAERRLADARAESAFLYGALEHLPVGLELYGPDGTALWLNRAMVEFVGLPSAEVAVGRFNVLTDPFSVQTGMVE
jgi:PAS domain-containing protein